ncbi:hypothetical protein CPS_3942 [Colwellia psychrerythraea 34H]|uniref:Uncharacterized protein n=1 Tax=Colwellia psychrerythraea (strain 34H / ATCC BAA-681) TaxID=167879 RepID=Q47X70_COLP3|nr:hypothetical protein CPS_3942 [Colwellia psychrerythraea 34H]
MCFHFKKNDVYFTYILIGSDFCQYIQTETGYYFYQTSMSVKTKNTAQYDFSRFN